MIQHKSAFKDRVELTFCFLSPSDFRQDLTEEVSHNGEEAAQCERSKQTTNESVPTEIIQHDMPV